MCEKGSRGGLTIEGTEEEEEEKEDDQGEGEGERRYSAGGGDPSATGAAGSIGGAVGTRAVGGAAERAVPPIGGAHAVALMGWDGRVAAESTAAPLASTPGGVRALSAPGCSRCQRLRTAESERPGRAPAIFRHLAP